MSVRHLIIIPLLWCVSLGIAPAGVADSPDVTVSASLSTNSVHVGDRVLLTVTAEHNTDQRVLLENIERPPFISVWDVDSTTKETKDKRRKITYTVPFSSFVVGQHRVSTNNLIVLEDSGTQQFIPIPKLLINVLSVLSNPPPALAEIKPAMSLPSDRWIRILVMVLVILAAGVIIALLVRAWIRRPEKPQDARVTPPHDIALNALDQLLKRGYIEDGNVEPFYVELSSIIRLYLEERFNLRAPEQTTQEFIRSSSNSNTLSLQHRQLTEEFLEQSDLVKFARFKPATADMQSAWDAGAKLVRETIPSSNSDGGQTS